MYYRTWSKITGQYCILGTEGPIGNASTLHESSLIVQMVYYISPMCLWYLEKWRSSFERHCLFQLIFWRWQAWVESGKVATC